MTVVPGNYERAKKTYSLLMPLKKRFSNFTVNVHTCLCTYNADEEHLPHRREGLLQLVEGKLVFLVLAQLFPVETGPAERVAVVGEPDDQIHRLHAPLVDEVAQVLRFVGPLHVFCWNRVWLGRILGLKATAEAQRAQRDAEPYPLCVPLRPLRLCVHRLGEMRTITSKWP